MNHYKVIRTFDKCYIDHVYADNEILAKRIVGRIHGIPMWQLNAVLL